jgi:hypothetical protein
MSNNNNNNNNNKKPGLAKDDEDVRVQSTNDEATVARACVLSDFVLHLFLSDTRARCFFLSFFLSFFQFVRIRRPHTERPVLRSVC